MGDDEVAETADVFLDRWCEERDRMVEGLRSCARYVDQALGEYEATELLLTDAVATPSPLSTPAGGKR